MREINDDELNKRINDINNPLNWEMFSDGQFKLEDLPPIIPLIFIQDNGCKKSHLFVFGNSLHDKLLIETKNNHSYLIYENLQSGCGSKFCDEGYEFYNNGNQYNLDYIEPNVKLVNLAKLIENYNKENGIDELKKENKTLREKGKDYALQIEILYEALQQACEQIYGGIDADEFIERAKKELKIEE